MNALCKEAVMRGVDHSTKLHDPGTFAREVKAAGQDFVIRYLANPGNPKVITAAELRAYHEAGLGVGLVWETTQFRPLQGPVAGKVDGSVARQQASFLGVPPDVPIFGAVDFAPKPDQLPTIAAYLEAGSFAPYGNGVVCRFMAKRGAQHFWLMDWADHDFDSPHIHQHGQIEIADVLCDKNEGFMPCCIWWPKEKEDDMLCFTHPYDGPWKDYHYRCDANGAVYVFDPDGSPDGSAQTYFGGLNTHPDWNAGAGKANGAPFVFGPRKEGGYFITTRDAGGKFHPYRFGPNGGAQA
jgi:hypothetical protein